MFFLLCLNKGLDIFGRQSRSPDRAFSPVRDENKGYRHKDPKGTKSYKDFFCGFGLTGLESFSRVRGGFHLKSVRKIVQISACLALLLITGCSINDSAREQPLAPKPNVHTNQPPEISALEFAANNVSVCDSVALECLVRDPDGDSLTCQWFSYKLTDDSELQNYQIIQSEYNGAFIGQNSTTVWLPGALKGKYLIAVYVTDPAGYEVSAVAILNVEHELCDNIQMVFEVTEIIGMSVEDFSKISRIVPSKIVFSNIRESEFAGKVLLDSLGWREIYNFDSVFWPNDYKVFHIDFSDFHPPDGKIVFSNLQITNEKLTGFWTLTCGACDQSSQSFTAIRK